MDYLKKYRYLVIMAICFIPDIYLFFKMPKQVDEEYYDSAPLNDVENVVIEQSKALVDVKGAVKYPGVYELDSMDRVINAIDLSGGLLDDADTSKLNLSQKLVDEMVIMVPFINQDIEDDIVTSTKISLNSATLDELMSLSGIGESKAKAIIEYRNGKKFASIEELINVKGISESLYEQIKDSITI